MCLEQDLPSCSEDEEDEDFEPPLQSSEDSESDEDTIYLSDEEEFDPDLEEPYSEGLLQRVLGNWAVDIAIARIALGELEKKGDTPTQQQKRVFTCPFIGCRCAFTHFVSLAEHVGKECCDGAAPWLDKESGRDSAYLVDQLSVHFGQSVFMKEHCRVFR